MTVDRAIRRASEDPELPPQCKDHFYRAFTVQRTEDIYAAVLRDYFSPVEADEFVAFLRTAVGAKFATREFESPLTREELRVYAAFGRSAAAASFQRFAASGMPKVQESILSMAIVLGAECGETMLRDGRSTPPIERISSIG